MTPVFSNSVQVILTLRARQFLAALHDFGARSADSERDLDVGPDHVQRRQRAHVEIAAVERDVGIVVSWRQV